MSESLKCECPTWKALEHFRDATKGLVRDYIDAALAAPCPCCIERDQLREKLDVALPLIQAQGEEIERLRAQVTELAEALRPFAAACLNIPPWPDTQKIAGILLRRAAAALAKVEVPSK